MDNVQYPVLWSELLSCLGFDKLISQKNVFHTHLVITAYKNSSFMGAASSATLPEKGLCLLSF